MDGARLCLMLAALLGGTGVAAGAFGAHGLKARVTPDLLQVWNTAAQYQLYHALALLALGALALAKPQLQVTGVALCFLVGVLVFSGSLYALTLTGIRTLGAITPLGGVSMLAGWAWLAVLAARLKS